MLKIMISWKVQNYFDKDFSLLDNAFILILALLVSLTFRLSHFPLNVAELESYDKDLRIKSFTQGLEFWEC